MNGQLIVFLTRRTRGNQSDYVMYQLNVSIMTMHAKVLAAQQIDGGYMIGVLVGFSFCDEL
jgi:hypothetical protein